MKPALPPIANRLLFVALAATLSASAAAAEPTQAHYCEVNMDLAINGHTVISPSAIVEFGKEAEFTIRDADGVHGWQIKLVVDEPSVKRRVLVMPSSMQLFELAGDQSILQAEPHLSTAPGQHADLQMTLADDSGRRATLGFIAEIRSDAEVQARLDSLKDSSDNNE